MSRRRRGLSPRMLWLTRWYAGSPEQLMKAATKKALEAWVAGISARANAFAPPTHGRSRRDGTRP